MNLYKQYITLKTEAIINPKKDAKLSKDLRKDEKSLTTFINKNYQKIMSLCSNKEKLKDFFKDGFDKLHISKEKIETVLYNFDKLNSRDQLQGYLTNILLKGSGNAVREDKKFSDYEKISYDVLKNMKKIIGKPVNKLFSLQVNPDEWYDELEKYKPQIIKYIKSKYNLSINKKLWTYIQDALFDIF